MLLIKKIRLHLSLIHISYKLVYEGDKLISREWFSSSTYVATADEVTVGTKPREAEPEDVPVIGEPTDPNVPANPDIPSTETENTGDNNSSDIPALGEETEKMCIRDRPMTVFQLPWLLIL